MTNVDLFNGTAGGGIWISEESHKMQLKFEYKDKGIKRQKFVSRGFGKIDDDTVLDY